MYLVDWQMIVLVLAIVVAGIAVVFEIESRRKFMETLEETEEYLEKYLAGKVDEKVEKSKQDLAQEKSSSADALIQKQHNELLQHLISLTKSSREGSREEKNISPGYRMDPQFYDRVAQMITQKVLEEIKKKW